MFKKIMTQVVRILVSTICIVVTFLERLSEWFMNLNARSEYVRAGKCKQCGKCCRLLAIYVPRPLRKINHIIKKWHKLAYGFNFEFEEDGWNTYSCEHLKINCKCGIYLFRFRICREFPKAKYFGKPYIHKDCGFYFIRRDGKIEFENIIREKMNKINQ